MTSPTDRYVLAYLGLGSNLGDREANIQEALTRLADSGEALVVNVSELYETAPAYVLDQPDFINACAVIAVEIEAEALLDLLLTVEADMGRVRQVDKGPRIIDLDILFYGDQVINSPRLTIPHPAMHERTFVLEPLAELAPQLKHPKTRVSVAEMLAALKG